MLSISTCLSKQQTCQVWLKVWLESLDPVHRVNLPQLPHHPVLFPAKFSRCNIDPPDKSYTSTPEVEEVLNGCRIDHRELPLLRRSLSFPCALHRVCISKTRATTCFEAIENSSLQKSLLLPVHSLLMDAADLEHRRGKIARKYDPSQSPKCLELRKS